MSKNKLFINSIISVIVVCICLFIFIKNSMRVFNFESLLTSISQQWIYLLLASLLLIISVYFRALRWKYLFASNISYSIKDLFSAQFIGYFINNIFPIRIGDFVKSYIVAKKTENKTSYILGSIIMERVLDTFMLCIFSIITIWYYGSHYLGINFSHLSFISELRSLFLVLLILILAYFRGWHKKFIPIKIYTAFSEIWQGFTGMQPSGKNIVLLSSFAIWLIYCTNAFLIQMIFPSLGLSILDCMLILVASSFIQFIPTGFGALGIFHLGVESVLIKLGVVGYHNFLIILWFYSYLIYTSLGAYYFIKDGKFTIKNLYQDIIQNY